MKLNEPQKRFLRWVGKDGREYQEEWDMATTLEETPDEGWYATEFFSFLIGVLKWLFPGYIQVVQRAFNLWLRKNLGYNRGEGSFHVPIRGFCGRIRIKITRYLLKDPTNEKLFEFTQKLLDGDAHLWEPE